MTASTSSVVLPSDPIMKNVGVPVNSRDFASSLHARIVCECPHSINHTFRALIIDVLKDLQKLQRFHLKFGDDTI